MNTLSRIVLRWAWLLVFVGTAVSVVGGYYSVKLFGNLRTDIEELLPTTARSVIDLGEVTRRLNSIDSLGVLVFSKHPEESKAFTIALANRLAKFPPDVIAGVEYRIDRELEFFNKRRALYMELEDLRKIRSFLQSRIQYEIELYNPLTIFRSTELPEPFFNFQALRNKYDHRVSSFAQYPDGFYANADQTIRVLLVNLPGKISGIHGAHQLRAAVDQAVAEIRPTKYAADIEVKFTGGVQNLIEEHASLISDLGLSTVLVILLVGIAMLAYYRTFRGTFALVASLFMGVLWTFGISYFMIGYLNANSAFMGSIVIGNGINFGIIFLARYLEERRKGNGNERAIYLSITETATATWTAALAAGLAYGSLTLTSFRGFNQFGAIGLVGMVLCWISAFTILPAFLTVLDRIPFLRARRWRKSTPFLSNALAHVIGRFPKVILGASLVLVLVSLAFWVKLKPTIIETDLSKLRDKKSMEEGSNFLSQYMDEVFKRYMSPVVILPKTREEAVEIASRLKDYKEENGEQSFISSVYSVEDFLPQDQSIKIDELRLIEKTLSPRIMSRLDQKQTKLVREFMSRESFSPVTSEQLPDLIRQKFTERDGSFGKMVLVEPPLTRALYDGDNLAKFIETLRRITDGVSPNSPVAGTLPVTSDMISAIRRDGPKATAFAFLAVVILVTLLFRNLQLIFLTSFTLFVGVFWLSGIILGFDLKINFLNFIALPISFGIGVDYGVNIFQRYRQEGRGSILHVMRNTGGAVGLASLTTIIGFGSLLIAGNQAFVSFGRLAVLGEITCLVAAMLTLPAFLYWRDRAFILAARAEGATPAGLQRPSMMAPSQDQSRITTPHGSGSA